MDNIWILLCLALLGCSSLHEAPQYSRPPDNLPEVIQNHLQPPESCNFELLTINKECETWQVASPTFSLKYLYFKKPGDAPRDLVVVFNILKDKRRTVSGWLVSNLLAAGYNCLIIQQEDFLSRKKLRPIKPQPGELLDWNSYFAQNLKHLSLIINKWIPQQPALSGRYNFVGISMGGILAVASAACFPEAQISISVMAGGDNYSLLSTSQESLVKRNFSLQIKFYTETYALDEAAAKARIQEDLEQLDFSILRLARCVPTNKIRQIISLYDDSVPTETQWALNEALGKPETRSYPSGHISLGLFAWSVRDQIIAWLQEANPDRNQ